MSEPYRTPPPEPPGKLPKKELGAYYAVVLREKDFSLLKVGVAGGLGGGGAFPIPELGDRCACCNAESAPKATPPVILTTVPFDASTDRLRVDPIDVPVCVACTKHLRKSTTAAQLIGGSFIPMAVGGAIWTAMNEIYLGTVAAVALFGGVVAWMLRDRTQRKELAQSGHHPHLEILVTIGQTSVRTTNKALAEHLVVAHEGEVHRAG